MTLLGQSNEPGYLRGYGPIDPETARRLTAQAPSLYRVLVDPGTDTVVQVGQEHYAVPPGLRRFLQLRDERCRFPGCNRNADLCDIDHTDSVGLGRRDERQQPRPPVPDAPPVEGTRVVRRARTTTATMLWTSPFGRKRITLPAVALAA